jgi:hypothetical protein
VQLRPVCEVVQFGEETLMSATVVAPPDTAIAIDNAEGEMYLAERAVDAGTAEGIASTTLPDC